VAKLFYSAITSLDGYVADGEGSFDWAAPDEAIHTFVNDLERPIGTYLYGRRMYEVMRYWETASTSQDRGLRSDLAGGRQDRVLDDAGGRADPANEARAAVRTGFDPCDEGRE
jgi:dihydrofolate reductase